MNTLKEWATVVNALENGDQTVILRKGGILETDSGFTIENKKFFLFPTFEHQETQHVKPEYHKHLENALNSKPRNGNNVITSFATVLYEKDVTSKEKIDSLSPFHVWSESYIKERLDWLPEKSMKAIFLKSEKSILLLSDPKVSSKYFVMKISSSFYSVRGILAADFSFTFSG